jgi:hypothetical protein
MRKYFIHDGQREMGPFDFDQLKTLQLTNETPIWFESLQNWTTAGTIPELQPIINSYSLPPKFEKVVSDTVNPPTFHKPEYVIHELPAKKKNIVRNVFIGMGTMALVYLLAFAFLSTNSNEAQPYNTETAEQVIDEPAVQLDYQEDEQARVNAEITARNRKIRNSIDSYVGVSTNTYTVDALGGITNLDAAVQNNTLFLLDEVDVEIEYIKENGNVFKTELVTIYNISGKQDKSVSVPDSERGLSVNVKVISIRSKELKLCYDNLVAPEAGKVDPYFCK